MLSAQCGGTNPTPQPTDTIDPNEDIPDTGDDSIVDNWSSDDSTQQDDQSVGGTAIGGTDVPLHTETAVLAWWWIIIGVMGLGLVCTSIWIVMLKRR